MAGVNLGTAYVQIMPSAKGIKGSITNALGNEPSSAGSQAGNTFAQQFVSIAKKVIVGAGIVKFVKDSMAEAGNLQQTYMGGLDTIYGAAADSARNYAKEAAKAGISMNDYAEQAIGFGASLRQAFEGDTAKAVEAANTAILDMTDNAAKMGTPLESIKNAYQGFAKQNYTMLDNLKLGYGGTKKEMERLLADAEKLSGQKYDISNLGDVYEAIHVIQGELGLTGVAAAEAADTFTGSMGAMKASIKNLMGNLALGNDITKDLEIISVSARTFIKNNMLPLFANVIKGIPTMLKQGIPELGKFFVEMLGQVADNADEIRKTAVNIVRYLITGIVNAAPELVTAVIGLVGALRESFEKTPWDSIARTLLINLRNAIERIVDSIFGDAPIMETIIETMKERAKTALTVGAELVGKIATGITTYLPTILATGRDILVAVINGIVELLPTVSETALTLLDTLSGFILDNLPRLLTIGMDIVRSLIGGILEAIPTLSELATGILTSLIQFVIEALPMLLTIGAELLQSLITGVVEALPTLLDLAVTIINSIVTFVIENLPLIIDTGVQLLMSLAEGLASELPTLINAITLAIRSVLQCIVEKLPDFIENGAQIIGSIAEGLLSVAAHIPEIMLELFSVAWKLIVSVDWLGLGKQIIDAISNGTISVASRMWERIKEIAKTAFDRFKNIEWVQLGIHAIKTIIEGLKSIGATIASALKEIAQNGLSGVKNINWASLGSNIINGIVSGLRAAGSAITNMLTSLAKSALNSVKRFLGIASPSKVFRDQIGKNVALGFAEGIEDNMSVVTDAMDDMAAETVLSMNPVISAAPQGVGVAGQVTNNITINASPGMDEEELADIVIKKITFTMAQAQAAWG